MIDASHRKEIAEKSVLSCGVNQPWKQLFAKKRISLGFMGGSVTQGYANYQYYAKAYPQMVVDALTAEGHEVDCHICATAGMGTLQANALVEREIIVHTPDIVFLEYAINETTLKYSVVSFESLVRRFVELSDPPIVVFLMLRSAKGYSCESYMQPIAEHYGLPSISLRAGINQPLADGKLEWSDYGDSESHPTEDGHRLLADCILALLDKAKSEPFSPLLQKPLPAPWLDAPYRNMRFFEAGEMDGITTDFVVAPKEYSYFHTLWIGDAAKGQTMTLDITCSALVLYYESHRIDTHGSARILLDGEPISHPLLTQSVMHCNSIYGWGNAMPIEIFVHDTPQTHRVTLTPLENKTFLYGFGVCGAESPKK